MAVIMPRTARKHPPLKDLLNAVWGAFFGLFFAGIAVAAARKDVDSLSWKEWMALAVFVPSYDNPRKRAVLEGFRRGRPASPEAHREPLAKD